MDTDTTIKIISLIISILSLLGFGTVMTLFWRDRHDKKKKELEETSELREQKRLADLKKAISEVIDEKISPMEEQIKVLGSDMQMVKRGVQVSCRTDLEEMYSRAEKAGYCSDYDKKRFEATYQAYHSLGKNGVMDSKYKRIMEMPESAPKKAKTRLNESTK